jgi:hypothetical protein
VKTIEINEKEKFELLSKNYVWFDGGKSCFKSENLTTLEKTFFLPLFLATISNREQTFFIKNDWALLMKKHLVAKFRGTERFCLSYMLELFIIFFHISL